MDVCKKQQPRYYMKNNRRAMCWLLDEGDKNNGE
jgi:hypothetical protein